MALTLVELADETSSGAVVVGPLNVPAGGLRIDGGPPVAPRPASVREDAVDHRAVSNERAHQHRAA